jgi:hypothetical protein
MLVKENNNDKHNKDYDYNKIDKIKYIDNKYENFNTGLKHKSSQHTHHTHCCHHNTKTSPTEHKNKHSKQQNSHKTPMQYVFGDTHVKLIARHETDPDHLVGHTHITTIETIEEQSNMSQRTEATCSISVSINTC